MGRWDSRAQRGRALDPQGVLDSWSLYVLSDLSAMSPFDSHPRAVPHAAQLSALSGPRGPANADARVVRTAHDGPCGGRRSPGRRAVADALTGHGLFWLLMARARCGLGGFPSERKGPAWRASERQPAMSYGRFTSSLSTRSLMRGLHLRVPRPCAAPQRPLTPAQFKTRRRLAEQGLSPLRHL
jgi:hypothetical protein